MSDCPLSAERATPLIMASQNGHTAVVEMLLKHQADVNARNQVIPSFT